MPGDPIKLGAATSSQLVFETGSRVTTSDSGIQSCSVKALCSDGANVFNNLPAAGTSFNSVFGNSYLPGTFLVDYTDSGPEIEYVEGKIARVTFNFKRQDPTQIGVRKVFTDSVINYKTILPPLTYALATGEPATETVFGFPEPTVAVKYNSNTRPGIGSGGLAQLYASPGSPNASGFPDAPDITVPYTYEVGPGTVVTYYDGTTVQSVQVTVQTVFNFNFIFKSNPRGWQLVRLKSDPVAAANFYDVEENWRNFYIFFGVQFVSAVPPPQDMPVILSDETWTRIQKMLEDYESGVLRVIPGVGMKYEEQVTVKSNCPGTKIGVDGAECPPAQMPKVRLFQGKPIMVGGKVALSDGCCAPCTGNATNGACCEPFPLSACFLGTLAECNSFNGNFLGIGSNCAPNPCPGACCTAGVCNTNVIQSDCVAGGGTFIGSGTNCAGVDCTCCPKLAPWTTFALGGSVIGCPTGDITIPQVTWTKSSPAGSCDNMNIKEWSANSVCGCTFMAMNCPPPFFTAIDFMVADCDGCSDPFEFNTLTQLNAKVTCDGEVFFTATAGDDSPTCKCSTAQIDTFVGPYTLGPSIDVTINATSGDTGVSFRFQFTAA